MLAYGAGDPGYVSPTFMSNRFGGHNVYFHFSFLHSITFENERSTVGFSVGKVENTTIFYNSEALYIVGVVWNTLD
jgi:hypothetical protein